MNDKPKELKEHSAHIFEMGCMEQRVYLKNDADAVIEAKDKVIAELKADYQEACDRLQTANLIKDEQLAETRHQKYKRSLRNAEGCKNKAWFYGEVHDRNAARTMWKWRRLWLELAEKFKTNSTAQ